jgi:hypothetical protein
LKGRLFGASSYFLQAVNRVNEEKYLTPRDEMKIYEKEDSECTAKRTTETNMQDVPWAAATVSAEALYPSVLTSLQSYL